MTREIERKFLVIGDRWKTAATAVRIRQGYLSSITERTVRVRIAGEHATITIKGLPQGVSRPEFEYRIPVTDANAMLDTLCEQPLIEKTRHTLTCGRHVWQVDEFHGHNAGLIVAEIELADPAELFERPIWIGREVSGDPHYVNANLVRHPFRSWASARGA